jgi:hypothetical protein
MAFLLGENRYKGRAKEVTFQKLLSFLSGIYEENCAARNSAKRKGEIFAGRTTKKGPHRNAALVGGLSNDQVPPG